MLEVIVIGNLGRDPESRTTDSGKTYVSFAVAVSNGRDRAPTWVNIKVWDKLGEICAQYLRKGSKVAVTGRPAARAWIGQDGRARSSLEVTADEVEFLSSSHVEDDQLASTGVDPDTGYAAADPEDKPY